VPGRFRLTAETGERSATLTLTGANDEESVRLYGNAANAALSVTLYADDPYIDLTFRLAGKPETPFVEAGHLSFPIRLPNARYAVHKLGQVVDPARDIVDNANHALYCSDRWVDVSDGEKGLAVIPLDTPLFSIGEKGILSFRRTYRDHEPVLLFNLFNNSWGTNFPQWIGGDFEFRYRLLPHKGDWREGGVAGFAEEAFAPLLGWTTETKAKSAAVSSPASGTACRFVVEDDGMELLCLKPAENGDGFIMRLHDVKGVERQVRFKRESPVRSVERCGLLENVQETMEPENDTYSFTTKPFEVHTFRIRL
jgi:alpha-mannosidase